MDVASQPPHIAGPVQWVLNAQNALAGKGFAGVTAVPNTAVHVVAGARIPLPNANLIGLVEPGRDKAIALSRNDGIFARHLSEHHVLGTNSGDMARLMKVKHPDWPPAKQAMSTRTVVIRKETTTHLATARSVLDLVKALVPYGSGNQIKDLVRTGGESYARAGMANRMSSIPEDRIEPHALAVLQAEAALMWQGGYCDHQAALAYTLLCSQPEMKNAQIDLVGNNDWAKHTVVVIRGETPAHDVIVDPWSAFPVPTLVSDAAKPFDRLGLRPDVEPSIRVKTSKAAGTQLPALNVDAALAKRANSTAAANPFPVFRGQLILPLEHMIADSLTDKSCDQEMFDVPFNGNPNVRYKVQDERGQLSSETFRFDLQRAALHALPG